MPIDFLSVIHDYNFQTPNWYKIETPHKVPFSLQVAAKISTLSPLIQLWLTILAVRIFKYFKTRKFATGN